MTEVRCPYCNALQFKVEQLTPGTSVEIRCHGRNCRRFLRISVTSTIQVSVVSTLDSAGLTEAYKPVEHK